MKKEIKKHLFFADSESSYENKAQKKILKRLVKGKNGGISLNKLTLIKRYSWLICIMNEDKTICKKFHSGKNTMQEYLEYIFNKSNEFYKDDVNHEFIIFYHNLNYDWSYIIPHLSKKFNVSITYEEFRDDSDLYEAKIFINPKYKDKTIKRDNKTYKLLDKDGNPIKIIDEEKTQKIIFRDTAKLFPIKVEKMGEILGEEKGDKDKKIVNGVYEYDYEPTEIELKYCEGDVNIIRRFYLKAPSYAKARLTLAGNTFHHFKDEYINNEEKGIIINTNDGAKYENFMDLFPKQNFKKYKTKDGKEKKIPSPIYIKLGEKDGRPSGDTISMEKINDSIRVGYTGGVTQVNLGYLGKYFIYNKYKNKDDVINDLNKYNKKVKREYKREYILTDGKEYILDVNSLYPFIMKTFKIPVGIPYVVSYPDSNKLKQYVKEGYFVIVEIDDCYGVLKNDKLPTIPKEKCHKVNTSNLYFTEFKNLSLVVNYEEFLKHLEHYDIYDYIITSAYIFRSAEKQVFNDYIDFFADMKEKASKTINEYKKNNIEPDEKYFEAEYYRQLAKFFMNTLYGKFGTNPIKESIRKEYDNTTKKWKTVRKEKEFYIDKDGHKKEYEEPKKYIYPAVAFAITSQARLYLFDLIDRIPYKYFLYCDTDSVHFIDNEIYGINEMKKDGLIDDNILGKWKMETVSECSVYLAPKKYGFIEKGKLEVKCAGLSDEGKRKIKNISEFYYGFTSDSKLQSFYVNGGIDLIKTNFKISIPKEKNDYKIFDETKNDYMKVFNN